MRTSGRSRIYGSCASIFIPPEAARIQWQPPQLLLSVLIKIGAVRAARNEREWQQP